MKTYVNLLSPKHQRAALVGKLALRWCAVWAVGLGVVAVVFWISKERHERASASISAAELACLPVVTAAQENARMLSQVRRFDCRETLAGRLGDDRPVLGLLAVVSHSARVCNERVVVRDLHFQKQSESRATAPARDEPGSESVAPAGPEAILTIEGDALDNLSIAKFAAALRDTGIFRDVELMSSVGKSSRELAIHSFVVRCEI